MMSLKATYQVRTRPAPCPSWSRHRKIRCTTSATGLLRAAQDTSTGPSSKATRLIMVEAWPRHLGPELERQPRSEQSHSRARGQGRPLLRLTRRRLGQHLPGHPELRLGTRRAPGGRERTHGVAGAKQCTGAGQVGASGEPVEPPGAVRIAEGGGGRLLVGALQVALREG